uniref:Uncharacterized protein n=1 Tax=Anguilla anguilla TaxID=7936 RepID=A0A0E9T3T5_ANGAN
MCRRSSGMS